MSSSNKIVEIVTEHSYEIKILFDVLKEILTEVVIGFTQDTIINNDMCKTAKIIAENCEDGDNLQEHKKDGGMRIIAVDERSTLIIYIKLNSSKFVKYHVDYQLVTAGLDLKELHKFMKGVEKDCIMTISIDKDDDQTIEFHLENDEKGVDTHYKQKLMDIDDNSKKIPGSIEFEMSVLMDTQDFRKICSEMSQFSEYIEITCTNREITFKCQGDSSALIKKFKHNTNDGGVKILCHKANKNGGNNIVQAIYNLKHLVTFGKCVNLCNEMQLFLKNDYPLFIQYTVASLGKMLVGLMPFDEKSLNYDDDSNDKHHKSRNK